MSRARLNYECVTSLMSGQFAYNTGGIASGVKLGTVPAGCRLLGCTVTVDTAFNAGTTNVFTVGSAGDSGLDNIVAAGDVTEGTPGSVRVLTGNTLTFTTDTDIFVSYTQTGTAATTGSAWVCLEFSGKATQ